MSHSFVRRAPAIAEEILAKTASLPENLKSFSRDLLSKEASDEREALRLPKRMTLADLSKLASGNHVDLPEAGDVNLDDYAKVASELSAIANREERRTSEEIFLDAAAIVAVGHEHEKQAVTARAVAGTVTGAARRSGGALVSPRFHNIFMRIPGLPGAAKRRAEHEMALTMHEHDLAKIRAKTPHATDPLVEVEKAKGERRHELAQTALQSAPAIGLAVGTPLAAAAMLKGRGEKKEEVKIYK